MAVGIETNCGRLAKESSLQFGVRFTRFAITGKAELPPDIQSSPEK